MLDELKIKKNMKVVISKVANQSTIVRIFWEQFIFPVLLLKDDVDILFCPGNISPILARVKTVQWIGTIGPFWNEIYKLKVPKIKFRTNKFLMYKTAQVADRVIFESNYTKDYFLLNYKITYQAPDRSHFG